jgi:hypothetical protein
MVELCCDWVVVSNVRWSSIRVCCVKLRRQWSCVFTLLELCSLHVFCVMFKCLAYEILFTHAEIISRQVCLCSESKLPNCILLQCKFDYFIFVGGHRYLCPVAGTTYRIYFPSRLLYLVGLVFISINSKFRKV